MTFTDLPDDWAARPLTEPRLVADVLDLLLSDADRREGALLIALCDDSARLLQPMVINDLPPGAVAGDGAEMLGGLFSELVYHVRPERVLVALGRPGGLSITPGDQVWRAEAQKASAGAFELLGVHVVTPDGSREIPG